MLTAKAQVQQILDQLPDDVSIEDLQYHLYVADLLRRRIQQIDQVKAIPQDEVEEQMKKWIKK
jgi:hypothetical protein